MDSFQEEQFSSAHLGHLGLVADKIDSLKLIDLIDARLPISEAYGAKISHGERVAAMIMNGLGFIDSRLYLFPDFLNDKPLDRLFNRHVEAQWFNDDASGRCLDVIAAYGSTKLLTELSITIGQARGLLGKSTHIDTTTLSLFGDYEHPISNDLIEDDNFSIPWPKQGYAKSGRHDLKQMVLLLATTGAANFPLWMESHSGNASDQTTMPAAAVKIREFCRELANAPDFIYVGDSAIYANILQHSNDMFWITRAPEKIKEVRTLVSTPEEKISWVKLNNGYAYHATTSDYKGVNQRWLMFFSEAAYHRENKTLDKKIKAENDAQNKAWWHLSNRIFTCKDDAYHQAEIQKKTLKFHEVTFSVVEVKKHGSKGRPKIGVPPEIVGYQIQYGLSVNKKKITETRSRKGRFVLATNQLDETILSNEEVLSEYKGQSGTERGFKFIKDDTFQVDSVFLKTPERIEALMMVMTLCLMVYGVSEYDLHQSLLKNNETIPSQTKRLTSKPSLRWVYFLFRVVNELSIKTGNHVQKLVVNLNGVLRKIIRNFGERASAIYLNPA
ncbi:MAG: IS1634 family transposase [Bacillota bacterium]|nr:IS1634 family transposase [Bacillota bacterium]